ncbi:MAG: ABC transporter substrate-binding protein [Clostridiales bacterium]
MKKLFVTIILVILMVTSVGCSQKEETTSAAEKEIKIGVSPYPAWYVWYIAEEEGLFEKYGLNVDLTFFPVYSDSLQAFNTGKIDMLNIAAADTIAPFNKDVAFKIVLINDNSNGADGLVAKNKFKTIESLKGQKVVTEFGTIEHYFLLKALEGVGLTEDDIEFTNMTVNDSGAAMVAGAVDAACVWEPSLSMALESGENHLLFSSADTPGLIPDLLVASDDLIEKNNKEVEELVNVWFDALEFYNSNPDKAAEDMAKYAEVSVDEMKIMMSGSKLFSIDENIKAMTVESDGYSYLPNTIVDTAKFLESIDLVESVPKEPVTMIDTSFIKTISENREGFDAPNTMSFLKD